MLPQRGLIALGLVFHWGSVPNPDTPCSTINPPDPLFKGAITAYGLSIAAWLPCPPAPARHLMTCLNPPNPLFKGAHQGLRAFHRHNGFPCPPAPARHLMMPYPSDGAFSLV